MESEDENYTYEADWQDEEDKSQSLTGEDDGYEGRSWCEDYSSSKFGYEPDGEEREPEPPDPSQETTSHQGWYGGETDQESNADEPYGEKSWCESDEEEPNQENRPWCEIPYSDHEEEHQEEDRPWCEIPEDDYEDASNDGVKPWCEETDSQISLDESPTSYGDEPESKEEFDEDNEAESEAGRDDSGEEYTKADEDVSVVGRDDSGEEYTEVDEDVSVVGRDEVRYINFAGHHQGPEAYLRWEQEMEDWLSTNQIPEEEKTIYAEDTLTEDAFRRWEQDAYIRLEYDEPDASWEEMKQLLYEEFVEDAGDMRQYNLRVYANPEPRRWILAKPKATPKRAFIPKPKKETTPALKEKTESKSTSQVKKKKLSAISLLEPHVEPHSELHAEPHPELKQGHTMENKANEVQRSMSMERQPLEILVSGTYNLIRYWNNFILPRCFKYSLFNDSTSSIMHLFFVKSVNNIAGTRENYKGDITEMKKVMNQRQNQSEPAPLMLTPSIMETRRVSNSCLIKEEPPDFKAQAQTRGVKQAKQQLKAPDQNRGVILSFFLKGEPPDAPCIIKPPPYQGKSLASQNRMKANLLSLGADCTVSRSKLFQGRGYDADIQIKPNREYTKPTGTCIKPVDMEHFGGFLPKWSPNQAQGLGLIIHQQINPKKTNDSSGGIKDQRAESPCWGNLTVALFFPYLGFVPMGLPRKVFNEATSSHQGIIYQAIDSKMLQVHIADVLADRPAALLAELLAELLSEVLRQMKPNKEIFLILHLDAPQSYIWKPGEHLGYTRHVPHKLWYTLPHKNPQSYYLPYMEPKEINLQQLYPSLFVRLCENLETLQKLPRRHNFLPKLTRYKAHLTCLTWTDFTFNVQYFH
ncbi:hypothetical protein ISN45_Aa07g035400 [Arabidopsis thaliana x Arabidopsis arenosa]|uniref:Uncharacterized protein n=1 Tax=Arabidopsis thaliana x Arabidopsis arenosa TaxID=1240361 RepID=A0A8T1YCM7_9BRAS|nr:hypothetical protein ISN45_Aa07g035400 [Arabidopsis thaliana x Arabidopsis arenosa]